MKIIRVSLVMMQNMDKKDVKEIAMELIMKKMDFLFVKKKDAKKDIIILMDNVKNVPKNPKDAENVLMMFQKI